MVNFTTILEAFGYGSIEAIIAMVQLFYHFHCFDEFGIKSYKQDNFFLSKQQAEEVLQELSQIDNLTQAWVVDSITNKFFQAGKERWEMSDDYLLENIPENKVEEFYEELLSIFGNLGFTETISPKERFYDHVLLLGALESRVNTRLDYLAFLWKEGVRFEHIYFLVGQRKLQESEPSYQLLKQQNIDPTETNMVMRLYEEHKKHWPKDLQNIKISFSDGQPAQNMLRPDTKSTIFDYLNLSHNEGNKIILAISNQPMVKYQDAVIRLVFNQKKLNIRLETVGPALQFKPGTAAVIADSLAREIRTRNEFTEITN